MCGVEISSFLIMSTGTHPEGIAGFPLVVFT